MKIRKADIKDAPYISKVHIDTWRTTYKGIVPDQVLDGLNYEKNSIRWYDFLSKANEMICYFVAEENGQIIGFANGGPNRTEQTGFGGELMGIYVLKEFQGKGIGKALVLEVAEWLSKRGYKSMLVWVLSDNISKHFYEALGGIFVGRKKIDIGGAALEESSYGWSNLQKLIDDLKMQSAL
jgi:GNAT superfamily N-acetyltransferase